MWAWTLWEANVPVPVEAKESDTVEVRAPLTQSFVVSQFVERTKEDSLFVWRGGSSFARPRTRRTTTSPSPPRPSGTCAACSCTPGTESPCERRSRSTRTRHSSNAAAPLPTCCSPLVDSPNYLSSRPRVVTLRSLHSSVRYDDSPASRDLTRASARSTQRRRNAQSMLSMVSSSLW